jgi:hypothetical protein
MSLASILTRPGSFTAPADDIQANDVGGQQIQLIADLTRVFIQDPDLGRAIADKITGAMVTELRGFLVSREEKARLAFGKARNLFAPMESGIGDFINGLNTDLLDTVPALIQMVELGLDGLERERVKPFVSDLWDIGVDDLQISGAAVQTLVGNLFDAVIDALKQDYLNGQRDDAAVALLDFSYRVERLKRFALDDMQIPGVEKSVLMAGIDRLWQHRNIDGTLETVKQIFDAGDEIVLPLVEIARCVIRQLSAEEENQADAPAEQPGFFAARSPEEYMMLMANDGATGSFSASNSGASGGNETMAWYASWVAGKNVSYSSNTADAVNIYENPELRGFTYTHVPRETMEALAFHTAWAVPALESIVHLISVEKGDVAANAVNIMWNFAEGISSGAAKTDFPRWAQWLGLPILTTLAGLEGHEGRWSWGDDPYVIINILGDYGEVYTYRRYAWTLRETILSVITLVNNDADQARQWRDDPGNPLSHEQKDAAWEMRNHNCFEGTAYFFGEMMTMLLPLILAHTDKKNYGFVGGGPAKQFWYTFLGGGAITWAGEYLFGAIAARLLAGQWFSNNARFVKLPLRARCVNGLFFSDLWGENSTAGLIFSWLPWLIGLFGRPIDNYLMLYFFTNGDTNQGTYCLDDTGVERQYMGFASLEHTSYKLPWTSGRTMQCVQNPMGVWSHFPEGKQTYAYDFSHKEGEPVLCARAGIVKRAGDTIPDHDTSDWNYIEIVHVMEIEPGTADRDVPGHLIRYGQVYSPYTGRRPWDDPAPTAGPPRQYENTNTNIPLDVVFPALPDGTDPTPRQSAARPAGTSFAFIDKNQDRAIAGKTFADTPGRVFAPDVTEADHGSAANYPAGSTFLPPVQNQYYTGGGIHIPAKGFEVMQGTCCSYGHGMEGFIQRVFSPRLSRPNKTGDLRAADIVGEYIFQGDQIMEAGDTGVSAYNHLHTHVTGLFADKYERNHLLTIPFLYQDHGVLKAMDFYTSNNDGT